MGPACPKGFHAVARVVGERVDAAIRKLVMGAGDVRRLTDVEPPVYRLRVGDWRVLFRFHDESILILPVLPRDKAYR
ncbi:MAG: type II toxin-antitoxin system RelE/ParE family toxin [Acidobacteriota bacterium]